jgi:hypothetical protein
MRKERSLETVFLLTMIAASFSMLAMIIGICRILGVN